MDNRTLKDLLSEQVARVGKALASPERLAEPPRNVEIVACCRGPFCLMSDEAVKLLQKYGYHARKAFDGVSEWRAAGLPLARP